MKRRNAAVDSGLCIRPDSMAHEVWQADQAQPVRRIARGAKYSAAGMGVKPIPGGASVARSAIQRGGVSDGSRRGETPSVA